MKRGRRFGPQRITNTGQGGFGFEQVEAEGPRTQGASDFIDDDPRHLFIGPKRLDVLLHEKGLGWVLELRRVMERLDYALLTVRYSTRGRRAYHPRTMLGLIMFGILSRQSSLRELEDLSAVHLGAWWMCGGHQIDHSTIGKFVVQHEEALGDSFFRALTASIFKQLNLRPGVSGIDGTVVEAASSRFAALRKEAAAAAAAQTRAKAEASPEDGAAQRAAAQAAEIVGKIEERVTARRKFGKSSESVTVVTSEPEAMLQPRKDGAIRPGYKLTTLMHEAGFIVGQHVHPSSETAAVKPVLEQHESVFEGALPSTLLADAGFFHGAVLREMAERNIDFLCPSGQTLDPRGTWEKKRVHGLFLKNAFTYDAARDVYVCPAGKELQCWTRGQDGRGAEYRGYRTQACQTCELRPQCTRSKRGRRIKRYDGDDYKEVMTAVLSNARARKMYGRRMSISEPIHAVFRELLGLRRFRRRGLGRVRAEAGLYAMAANVRKFLGDPALSAALATGLSTQFGRLVALICARRPFSAPFPGPEGPTAAIWRAHSAAA